MHIKMSLILCTAFCSTATADDVRITPDVVYGHKFGMALTFDVFRPAENGNGAGVLFMVSGVCRAAWQ